MQQKFFRGFVYAIYIFSGLKYVVILFHKGPRQQDIYFILLDLMEDVA